MIDFKEVGRVADGQWPEVLQSLGVPAEIFNGRHQRCAGCGGKDRFRWDAAKQVFFCNQGGVATGGDGFSLLCHVFGWTKSEALHAVADRLGIKPDPESRKKYQAVIHKKQAAEYEQALAHECRVLLMVLEPRIAGRELARNHKFMQARQGYQPPPESHWEREIQAARRVHKLLPRLYVRGNHA